MNIFELIGMIVVGAFLFGIASLVVLLVMDFFDYQRGARNYRDYLYNGEKRSQWYWIKHGAKRWFRSFRQGGGWYSVTTDPKDEKYNLEIYENGKIVRKPA